jgi:hypothetical protein
MRTTMSIFAVAMMTAACGDEMMMGSPPPSPDAATHADAPATIDGAMVTADAADCAAGAPTATECESCCEATHADGFQAAEIILAKTCDCAVGLPCQPACSSNACMGSAPSATCELCMRQINSDPACITTALAMCETDPTCASFVTCDDSCSH